MKNKQGIIITQTPFRISFFGGGTDFPEFFNEHGGCVLGAAIDKYLYVTMNSLERFYDKRIRLSYSQLESVNRLEELNHVIARQILQDHPFFNDKTFLDIHTFSDLPAASGMGSSSTFAVGMLNALYHLDGEKLSPDYIAREAIDLERNKLNEAGGWQDQIFAAYGGFNKITFANNNFTVEPVLIKPELRTYLAKSCILVFTGDVRSSADVQVHMQQSFSSEKCRRLLRLKENVTQAIHIIEKATVADKFIRDFATLLDEAWQEKRSLASHISNQKIDALYDKAKNAGALGGKLCGAGAGGFLLLVIPEEQQVAVREALKDHILLPFNFCEQGSHAIYHKHETTT